MIGGQSIRFKAWRTNGPWRDVFPYDVVTPEYRYALCGSSRLFVFGLRDEPIKLAKGFCPRLPIVNYSGTGDGCSVSMSCHARIFCPAPNQRIDSGELARK